MKVVIVPVLEDNFAYLLVDEATKKAAAVDPAGAQAVAKKAEELGVKIECILTTHHHWDHAGGNDALIALVPGIEVYGGDERCDALSKLLKEGDTVQIGGIKVTSRFSPCHTTGHLLYFCEQGDETPVVFTGDTLFVGGCGRFFEGTPDQMNMALNTIIANMPDETLVYVGHEYTRGNLLFALDVEPGNEELKKKMEWTKKTLAEGGHTTPSTVGGEKQYNPFMRLNSPEIRKSIDASEGDSTDVVMGKLRKYKDTWKPKM